MNGKTQSMTVITPYSPGAYCTLKDSKKGRWIVSSTPGEAEVERAGGTINISCSNPDYVSAQKLVGTSFNGATLGNVIAGGLIGMAVDASTGANKKYPDTVLVWLEPEDFSSPQSKEMWFAEKDKYENPKNKKQNSNQNYN